MLANIRYAGKVYDSTWMDAVHLAGEADGLDEECRSLMTYACIYVGPCFFACPLSCCHAVTTIVVAGLPAGCARPRGSHGYCNTRDTGHDRSSTHTCEMALVILVAAFAIICFLVGMRCQQHWLCESHGSS